MNSASVAPLVATIGWALVHFIWQGAVIGAITAVALRLLTSARAEARYAAACAGLAVMLAAPLVAVFSPHAPVAPAPAASVATPAPSVAVTAVRAGTSGSAMAAATTPAGFERWLPAAVSFWLAGVCLFSCRLAVAYRSARRLTRQATRPVQGEVIERVHALAARLHIRRRVAVLESSAAVVPAVIGWLRPVILLPATVLAGLPPAHLDAVIAHELAHVRRHDYLVNALQACVETLLFFHPAVWWCSRQVRIEREHCCDDLVVTALNDCLTYAAALASLEELRQPHQALALGATDGSLLQRVRRLLSPAAPANRAASPWLVVAGLTVMLAVVLSGPTMSGSGDVSAADVAPEPQPSVIGPRLVQVPWVQWWNALASDYRMVRLFGAAQLQAPLAPAPPVPPAPPASPTPPGTAHRPGHPRCVQARPSGAAGSPGAPGPLGSPGASCIAATSAAARPSGTPGASSLAAATGRNRARRHRCDRRASGVGTGRPRPRRLR